ncbi:iron chelate uptake ABC transporter family permease subunit [Micromonospora sp. LOL_021]|uniref:iron chelate uptake ABC transporter family permease subunit n=1 Tax=Micromonospora sp. LOL_021 TaxID=3345417 RepID=UPI003A8414BE
MGPQGRRRYWTVLAVVGATAVGTGLLGLLAGNTWLLTGDIVLWLTSEGSPVVRFALDERAPRVAAALAAGAALALSGSLVQATCRNPLAEPGILGITGGAGLAAVVVVTGGNATMIAAATGGVLAAFGLVYSVAWRGGLHTDRLVLVGVGVWYAATALTTYLLVRSNPWDTPKIYTWLSGTTYGRSWTQVVPVVLALLVALAARRELDLLAIDEDTPRIVPVAVLLGAVLLGLAGTVGRTVVAPAQLPAGLAVALIGAPYIVYLLARSRA